MKRGVRERIGGRGGGGAERTGDYKDEESERHLLYRSPKHSVS